MGLVEDQSLWINGIIAAENENDQLSCVFPPQRLAQIANEIIEGRIVDKIVGWYHSHPGHGLFLSQTDLNTHMQFHQFSSQAVSLVVDPNSQEFGIWIYEAGTGVVQLPSNYINII
jgi:hypothetical protein